MVKSDMRQYYPEYYKNFKCTADKCQHNCCIGWEIDIDPDTYTRYRGICGEFGKKLNENISQDGGEPHFILTDGERCPFLNSNNLCNIYINLGEEALCEICDMHPRYRNFFDSFEEVGLGLSCEAAAELILKYPHKVRFLSQSDEEAEPSGDENDFLSLRSRIIELLQDRSLSIDDRIELLFENFGIDLPDMTLTEWAEVYLRLERLDPKWTDILNSLKGKDFMPCHAADGEVALALEQLLVYFIFRHLSEGFYDGLLYERAAFAVLSTRMICAVCTYCISPVKGLTLDGLIEAARLYSLEIEYSDENTDALLEKL